LPRLEKGLFPATILPHEKVVRCFKGLGEKESKYRRGIEINGKTLQKYDLKCKYNW